MLATTVKYETEEMLYRVHTANALSIIANGLFSSERHKLDYPMYTDLIGIGKKGASTDTRSADDIKRDILKKLVGD